MTFYSAEASVQDSRPLELIYIAVNDDKAIYRHTTGVRDVVFDTGNGTFTFTAIAADRGAVTVTMPGKNSNDVTLTLPIDHALARRWTQQGVPPKKVDVVIYRQDGGETEIIWAGPITSMAAEGKQAMFRVPSRAGEWMLRQVPTDAVGRSCPVMVYSAACGVSRSGSAGGLAFKVTTTVISVSGRDVTVDLGDVGRNGTWAEGGEIVHTKTGERMTVGLQTDANAGVSAVATLTMQMQIVGMTVSDSVDIYRGCAHTIADCRDGFDNRQNYKGFPHMPSTSPYQPGGLGGDQT